MDFKWQHFEGNRVGAKIILLVLPLPVYPERIGTFRISWKLRENYAIQKSGTFLEI